MCAAVIPGQHSAVLGHSLALPLVFQTFRKPLTKTNTFL